MPRSQVGHSTRFASVLLMTLVGFACTSALAPVATASFALSVGTDVPANVTVGQAGVPGSFFLANTSNGVHSAVSVQLDSISLVPSCGSTAASADCPIGFMDPGVIVPNPSTGAGEVGTACAGGAVTFAVIDAAQGKYAITPGSTVTLGPSSGPPALARCVIDFVVDVVKAPTIDAASGQPGLQTSQVAAATGTGGGFPAASFNTSSPTVTSAPPTI